MPIDYSKYPKNWFTHIRPRIMARATGPDQIARCEQCGAPNHHEILRHSVDPSQYVVFDYNTGGYRLPNWQPVRVDELPAGFDATKKHTKVILTIHHIGAPHPDGTPGDPRDKMDCRDENLIALCQRCHLLADLPHHMEERRKTLAFRRKEKLEKAGQLALFE